MTLDSKVKHGNMDVSENSAKIGGGAAAVVWEQCGIHLSMGNRNTKLNCVLNSFCPLISKVKILEMSFYFSIVLTSPLSH